MEGLPRRLSIILDRLPSKFQPEHFLAGQVSEKAKGRCRKFTPVSLLLTLFYLVSGKGGEGYDHALIKTFGIDKAPVRSALHAVRSKIYWRFVEDVLFSFLDSFESYRPTYEGLRIYAVDGQQLTLPRTKDIVMAGFSGRALADDRESYMPKAYLTHAYDVLSGTTKDVTLQKAQTELVDALGFLDRFEKNSLTLYDRLYFSQALCRAHLAHGSYFLMRCQSNANAHVGKLLANPQKDQASFKVRLSDGAEKTVWLIKVKRENDDAVDVFATNLPRRLRNARTIDKLYRLRWEVENSFRELTDTLKLEQWHAKTLNGIKQELYALFILTNITKTTIFFAMGQRHIDPDFDTYYKPNFKLIFDHVVSAMGDVFQELARLMRGVFELVIRTLQKRRRRSRSYPRCIRSPASPYTYNNTEPRDSKRFVVK